MSNFDPYQLKRDLENASLQSDALSSEQRHEVEELIVKALKQYDQQKEN